MNGVECPACGSTRSDAIFVERCRRIFRAQPLVYSIVRCRGCSSEFSVPMQSAPPGWYQGRSEFYSWRWEFTEALRDLQPFLAGGRRRVLEIGCGAGILLGRLDGMSDAYGLDINAAAVQQARSKGLRASASSLEEFAAEQPLVKFHAVLVFHMLEHLADPAAFLTCVRHVLHADGHLMLSVPNPDRAGVLFGREEWDYPPHHLSRFSRRGLDTLLTRSGFLVETVKDEPSEGALGVASMLANGLMKRMGVSVTGWKRPARAAVKSPIVFACLPLALYERRHKPGLGLYVVARSTPRQGPALRSSPAPRSEESSSMSAVGAAP